VLLAEETTIPTVSDAGKLLMLLVSDDGIAGGPASAFPDSEEGGGPNCCKSSLFPSFCSGAATIDAASELVSAAALLLEVASATLLLSCGVVVSSWGAPGRLPTAALSETAATPKSGVVSSEAPISLEVSSVLASAPPTWVLFSAVLATASPPSLPLVPALLGAATPSVSGIPPPFRPMK
jgi:hypothetical protein